MTAAGPARPSALTRDGRWRANLCLASTGLMLAALLILAGPVGSRPLNQTAAVTGLMAVAAVGLCVWSQARGPWACSSVYLITLTLFHFGLAPLLGTHAPVTSSDGQLDFGWIASFDLRPVLALAGIGVLSAAFGVSVASVANSGPDRGRAAFRPSRAGPAVLASRGRATPADQDPTPPDPVSAAVGFVILAAAIGEFLRTIVNAGGFSLLFGSYQNLIALVYTNHAVPYLDFGLGFGLVLLVASGPSRPRAAGLALFAAFALIALPLGMRGTIMFPALAAAAIAARRRLVVPGAVALIGGFAVLCAVGPLREIRHDGLSRVEFSRLAFSPVDGLAEMGASIRPLAEVEFWHDGLGQPSAGGQTYTGELTRFVHGRLLGTPEPSAATDDRLFNTVMAQRVGQIGGSPIAEAYYNFRTLGIVVVMFAIGLLCGWLDTGKSTRATDPLAIVVLVPLLIGVRNDFTPLPLQVLIGGSVVLGIRLVASRGPSRRLLAATP